MVKTKNSPVTRQEYDNLTKEVESALDDCNVLESIIIRKYYNLSERCKDQKDRKLEYAHVTKKILKAGIEQDEQIYRISKYLSAIHSIITNCFKEAKIVTEKEIEKLCEEFSYLQIETEEYEKEIAELK